MRCCCCCYSEFSCKYPSNYKFSFALLLVRVCNLCVCFFSSLFSSWHSKKSAMLFWVKVLALDVRHFSNDIIIWTEKFQTSRKKCENVFFFFSLLLCVLSAHNDIILKESLNFVLMCMMCACLSFNHLPVCHAWGCFG